MSVRLITSDTQDLTSAEYDYLIRAAGYSRLFPNAPPQAMRTETLKVAVHIYIDPLRIAFSGERPTARHRPQAVIALSHIITEVQRVGTFDRRRLMKFLRACGYRLSVNSRINAPFRDTDWARFIKKHDGANQYTLDTSAFDVEGSIVEGDLEQLYTSRA